MTNRERFKDVFGIDGSIVAKVLPKDDVFLGSCGYVGCNEECCCSRIYPRCPKWWDDEFDDQYNKMNEWTYVRTAETIIGMNFETGELKKFKVFCCPKCGKEITDWVLANTEVNYCSRCGNRNYKPDCIKSRKEK